MEFTHIFTVSFLMFVCIEINAQTTSLGEDEENTFTSDSAIDFTNTEDAVNIDISSLEFTTQHGTTEVPTAKTTTQNAEQTQTAFNNKTLQQDVASTSKPLGPNQFQLLDETGNVCIKAQIKAQLIVHYISSKKTSLQQATIPVDTKSTVGGICTPEQARLTLSWLSKNDNKYSLQTSFNMINDSVKCSNSKNGLCWMLTSIQFTYDSTDRTFFYHAKDARIKTVQTNINKEFFKTPDTMSQICDKDILLKLPATSDNQNKDEVDIKFIMLHIQPFSLVNNTFGPRKECEEGNARSQSVVSVAVGATLGVVILIVIIIYAVGRRIGAINDRTGYKSVD